MKIEIKPFNDLVRFTPSIIFLGPEKRFRALGPVHYSIECNAHRKSSAPLRIY
jgi:hypothetical protein